MVALTTPLPPGTKLFLHPPAQAAQVDHPFRDADGWDHHPAEPVAQSKEWRQESLIDAAEEYAKKYDDDDRELIKTDVLNAFYHGANWSRKVAKPRAVADGLADAVRAYLQVEGPMFKTVSFVDKPPTLEQERIYAAARDKLHSMLAAAPSPGESA